MNNNRAKLRLIIVLISVLIIIPNLLVSNQRDIKAFFDAKNTSEVVSLQHPRASSVYYEDTNGFIYDVYVSRDYAYVVDGTNGLAVIDIINPIEPGEGARKRVDMVDPITSDNIIMIVIIIVSIAGVVGVGIAIFVLRKRKRAGEPISDRMELAQLDE